MFRKIFRRKKKLIKEDKPVLVMMVDENKVEQPNINGYTLQVNLENPSASIINLTKGGRSSMTKTVVKALEGFEKMYDELNEMKANLEVEKEHEKEVAFAKIEEKYSDKSAKIDEILAGVSVTEEIEVPDEEVSVESVEDKTAEKTISF